LHVVVIQHLQGSADSVFLDACRVCLSQQYNGVQHNLHLLNQKYKKKKKKKKKKTHPIITLIFHLPVKHKNINKIIIISNINKNNTNTSKTLSTIFSFNISDL
jgi:hypothetical protein